MERVPQARRPHAAGGSTGGEQRAQVARRARQTRRAVDDGDEGVIQTRLDVDVGERRRREQQHVGEEVVESSAGATDDDHVRRTGRARCVQRELEVALVLLGGIPADLGAAGDGGLDRGRIGRVEVSDDEVDVPAQRERVLDARVGGDGEDFVRQARRARSVDRLTAREDERHARFGRLHDPSLRRNYPVQVPRVGDAATHTSARPPSQPGCPELPTGRGRS